MRQLILTPIESQSVAVGHLVKDCACESRSGETSNVVALTVVLVRLVPLPSLAAHANKQLHLSDAPFTATRPARSFARIEASEGTGQSTPQKPIDRPMHNVARGPLPSRRVRAKIDLTHRQPRHGALAVSKIPGPRPNYAIFKNRPSKGVAAASLGRVVSRPLLK
jgi:hypothetical protein